MRSAGERRYRRGMPEEGRYRRGFEGGGIEEGVGGQGGLMKAREVREIFRRNGKVK